MHAPHDLDDPTSDLSGAPGRTKWSLVAVWCAGIAISLIVLAGGEHAIQNQSSVFWIDHPDVLGWALLLCWWVAVPTYLLRRRRHFHRPTRWATLASATFLVALLLGMIAWHVGTTEEYSGDKNGTILPLLDLMYVGLAAAVVLAFVSRIARSEFGRSMRRTRCNWCMSRVHPSALVCARCQRSLDGDESSALKTQRRMTS